MESIEKLHEIKETIQAQIDGKLPFNTTKSKNNLELFIKMRIKDQEVKDHFLSALNKVRFHLSMYSDRTPQSHFDNAKINGLKNLIDLIDSIEEVLADTVHGEVDINNGSKVFIVHGHNDGMKYEVARFIDKQNLDAVILDEAPNSGKTIIEKFESVSEEIGYAIVLLSADELVEGDFRRSRPNVMFELGYFFGKLGRNRVCLLRAPDAEIPSDLSGIIYIDYQNNNNGWKMDLTNEMKNAGFEMNNN